MTEETIIRAHDSGRRPFTTPEGYFEGFTERLMQKLPPRAEASPASAAPAAHIGLTPARRLMRYAAAIAVAAACVGGGALLLRNPSPADTSVAVLSDEMVTDENIDEMLDYEMLSNNQIAYYLTEAY